MKVLKVEAPAEVRSHLIWVGPSEGEDWGELTDDVYHDRRFKPNKVCVVVRQRDKQFWADWMQAREETEGEGWQHCGGTYEFNHEYLPGWAREVEDFAVNAVKDGG